MTLKRIFQIFAIAVIACGGRAFAEEAVASQPVSDAATADESNPEAAQGFPRRPPIASPQPTPEPLTRFDLDFHGGTPAEFVAAISKAMGKHVNVIIPERDANVRIMPIAVRNVTVPELFSGVATASVHDVMVVYSRLPNGQPASSGNRNVSVKFTPASDPVTDQTVWSFSSDIPNGADLLSKESPTPPPVTVCRYYQLAPYLEDHTIEDITTAIQTGWKMSGIDPAPKLSFHKETKLLIAVGPEAQVDQIPQVLNAIAQDNSVAVKSVEELQAEIAKVISEKKEGWQEKAKELNMRIAKIAARQSALQELNRDPRAPRPALILPQ